MGFWGFETRWSQIENIRRNKPKLIIILDKESQIGLQHNRAQPTTSPARCSTWTHLLDTDTVTPGWAAKTSKIIPVSRIFRTLMIERAVKKSGHLTANSHNQRSRHVNNINKSKFQQFWGSKKQDFMIPGFERKCYTLRSFRSLIGIQFNKVRHPVGTHWEKDKSERSCPSERRFSQTNGALL